MKLGCLQLMRDSCAVVANLGLTDIVYCFVLTNLATGLIFRFVMVPLMIHSMLSKLIYFSGANQQVLVIFFCQMELNLQPLNHEGTVLATRQQP